MFLVIRYTIVQYIKIVFLYFSNRFIQQLLLCIFISEGIWSKQAQLTKLLAMGKGSAKGKAKAKSTAKDNEREIYKRLHSKLTYLRKGTGENAEAAEAAFQRLNDPAHREELLSKFMEDHKCTWLSSISDIDSERYFVLMFYL